MDPNPYQAPHYHQEPLPKAAPLEIDPSQPLSVEFDLTLDDYVAFNLVHRSNAALMKWMLLSVLGVGWVSIPAMMGIELYRNWAGHLPQPLDSEEISFMLFYALFHAIGFPLLTWWMYPFMTRLMRSRFQHFFLRMVIRWMLAGDTSSIFGHYKLTLSAEMLHEMGPKNETSFKMSAVQKLITTDEYLFIYVSPVQAYIVPRRVFPLPEDFLRFVRTVEEWTHLTATN